MKHKQQENSKISFGQLALTTGYLGVLAGMCYYFEIGGPAFSTIILLTVPAFLVNALLPLQYRLAWYVAVSLVGFALVLGVANSLWLVGVVCAFVGVCHLPVALRWRVLVLLIGGGTLAYLKANGWLAPWSHAAWPIIASILMFRLIIYLYDLHHDKNRPPVTWSLSYFFLMPNVCFPLFPVVDFKKFRASYYSEAADVVYKRGLLWIFRGTYQLLLYRLVYQFMVIPPSEVFNALQFLQFMLSAYLLYLRVSGLFHLIVGLLLLFGFNLPETHKKYYLASSFNDFWRRINIYWKDFMMKIFYYPVYFKVKSLGPTPALVIATITVFLCTWALHAYQWFWLRGTLLFEAHDLLFWGLLGALVVINSLREIKHGRQRIPGRHAVLSMAGFAHGCRVLSTFTALCILWSMWSSDSLEQWLLMWQAAGIESAMILAIVPVCYFLANWAEKKAAKQRTGQSKLAAANKAQPAGRPALLSYAGSGVAVVALAGLVVVTQAGSSIVPEQWTEAANRIRSDQLNKRDEARMERGYYEHLLNVNRHSAGLWDALDEKPADWDDNLDDTTIAVNADDFLITVLSPSTEISFRNHPLRTNRWGMRDREYEKTPPPHTNRVALIGSSHVLGSGVANEQVFGHLLEQKLNSNKSSADVNYEILNFAMVAYSSLQQLRLIQTKVVDFNPDMVVYFQIEEDERFILRNLSLAIRNEIDIPFSYVRNIVDELELDSSDTDEEIRRLLAPHAEKIQAWGEQQLIASIREIGAKPVCVLLPRVQDRLSRAEAEQRQRVTGDSGCLNVDLTNVYHGYSRKELQVARWDNHPNAVGHELIARRLFDEFTKNPKLSFAKNDDSTSHQ